MNSDLSIVKLTDFFYRYHKFAKFISDLRLNEFKKGFGQIRSGIQAISDVAKELNKYTSSEFNIFSLFSISYDEVRTHSSLLADLLNPKGMHGQNDIFLYNFIKYCNIKYPYFPIPDIKIDDNNNIWFIDKEKVTSFGNLDIVISSPDLRYLIVIENKIYASEQKDQLRRYVAWMDTKAKFYDKKALIYLTPYGNKSLTGDGSEFILSYHDDIYNWLKGELNGIKSSKVSETIKQYLEIIRTF
jgi:hypothetical protein